MDTLIQDIRYAVRGLLRSPGFTAAVVLTLALGIGANTTMFGVLDTLLLKPPAGVRDASRVARVYFRLGGTTITIGGGASSAMASTSFPAYEALRGVRGFAGVAAFGDGGVSIGTGAEARPARIRAVTASYVPLLGGTTVLGRFFDSTEDRLGAGPVAVVSHAYWMRQMGGDPAVLHRTLAIGPFAYAIIGVATPGFAGAELEEPDVWLPIHQAAPILAGAQALSSWNWFWVQTIVRLAPGVTSGVAASEATLVEQRAMPASSAPPGAGPRARRAGIEQVVLGPIQAARGPGMTDDARVALWVGAVALAVLLVACANVGNLLLARALRRRTELAVRAGLGAGRAALVRQVLVESLVLALLGGAAALLVALWGGAAVRAYLLRSPVPASSILDPRVLAFTTLAALATGLLAGVAPAWQAGRTDLSGALRSGGRDVSPTRGRLRSALLATQVALTLVLLVGAGLFVRSLRHAQTLDYGFDVDHLLLANARQRGGNVSISRQLAASPEGPVDPQSARLLRMREKIRANPLVTGADALVGMPYQSVIMLSIRVSGRDTLPRLAGGGPFMLAVTPTYFATVGTRILRGRGFTDGDVKGSLPVAVVDESFAKLAWPDRDAIGQCIFLGDTTCIQVVGVAADVRGRSVTQAQSLNYYLAFQQQLQPPEMSLDGLVIRTRGPAAAAAGLVQHALQVSEPDLPYVQVQTLADRIAPQWRSWQLGATMLSLFGLLALVIASLGLYGVTAYGVAQRTQEIGVRIALGAGRRDVVGLAVTQAVRATAVGAAIGMLLAFALGRAVAALLFGVKPLDPLSILGGVAVLLTVAAVAAYLPARRAAGIDPMQALRTE
ncbi:MAG TPA: ADOP family duplicated permease [Gemmatimonadales bacterium]|nr:ADOP family duplicated permease [Gemmatimonadales bacterium]